MRLLFVYYLMDDRGSAQDIRSYARTAKTLGHQVEVYSARRAASSLTFSQDVESADLVVFIFEWTTNLRHGGRLDWVRLMAGAPRRRRVVIDCDGNYNDAMSVDGDHNHKSRKESCRWTEICDSLSDKVCQPTLHPLKKNVRTFFFHAYDPAWEVPLNRKKRQFGLIYIGHSKFRWKPMKSVLRTLEPVRDRLGRIGIVGHGWDCLPEWAKPMGMEDVYFTDTGYLKKMNVEILDPISSRQVIPFMSKSLLSPVLYRPLFRRLQFVTCRTFETPAAAAIPLLDLDESYVLEVFGERAPELVLRPGDSGKIEDILRRPDHYAQIVGDIRRHFAEKHSYRRRLEQLIEIGLS